jgi:enoyl-CoA hydratase/carnithine racemase
MIDWQEEEGGVGVITLSRPPVNAFDTPSKQELFDLLGELEGRSDVRSIVIRSALPRTFCAGSDLRELAGEHTEAGVALARTRFELGMWQRLSRLPQVSVAAIDGHALGSGLELAVACDFRVAGAAATLGLPEIRIGGAPGVQVLARLPLLVGLGTATRMLLLGETLGAEEAAMAGLVHEVVPQGQAEAAARRLAGRLAHQPRSSVRFLKDSVAAALEPAIERVTAVAEEDVEGLFGAAEMREGIAAFLEKRPPRFHPDGEHAGSHAAAGPARGADPT